MTSPYCAAAQDDLAATTDARVAQYGDSGTVVGAGLDGQHTCGAGGVCVVLQTVEGRESAVLGVVVKVCRGAV